jgi:hypothetical protein
MRVFKNSTRATSLTVFCCGFDLLSLRRDVGAATVTRHRCEYFHPPACIIMCYTFPEGVQMCT